MSSVFQKEYDFFEKAAPETKSAPFRGASTEQISLAGAAAHEADDEGAAARTISTGQTPTTQTVSCWMPETKPVQPLRRALDNWER